MNFYENIYEFLRKFLRIFKEIRTRNSFFIVYENLFKIIEKLKFHFGKVDFHKIT